MCQLCIAFTPYLEDCAYSGLAVSPDLDLSDPVDPVAAPGDVVEENGDAAGGTSTNATVAVGEYFEGTLTSLDDSDWIEVELVAGQTYTFAAMGLGALDQRATDLDMYLRDSAGTTIEYNDGLASDYNPTITFTATTSGTYYIDIQNYSGAAPVGFAVQPGDYGVSITEGSLASYTDNMAAGNLLNTLNAWTQTPGTGPTLTWAVRATGTDPSNNTPLQVLNASQVALAQTVTNYIGGVTGLEFTQVNPGGTSNDATILIGAYTSTADGAGAYAYYPGTNGGNTNNNAVQGDIWLNNNSYSGGSYNFGSFNYFALLHEFGHAIGLPHPGGYNAGPGQSITYAQHAEYAQDTHQYTVMSYFDEGNSGASGGWDYPDTFMLHDYLALHMLYGADASYNSGNTTYGFNATDSGSVYDFTANSTPFMTVYDGAGNDTIDLSGYSMANFLTLEEGVFSNIGGYVGRFSIAYGAVIENAVGGTGNDKIIGNDANNRIEGNSGNDTLIGGAGNDTLDGGAGDDVVEYKNSFFSYSMSKSGGVLSVGSANPGELGTDQLISIEKVAFSDGEFDGSSFKQTAVEDSGNSFAWANYVDIYDIDKAWTERVFTFDNGQVLTSTYSGGAIQSSRMEDTNNNYAWDSYTNYYDGSGALTHRIFTYVDTADAFDWASYADTFDAIGVRTARETTYDNGQVLRAAYTDGALESATMEDTNDIYFWDTYTNFYDNAGALTGRVFNYVDDDDTFAWTTYSDRFNASDVRISREMTYDNGRQDSSTFTDGVIATLSATDAGDVFIWAELGQTFDAAGRLAEQVTTYDNGQVLTSVYSEGALQSSTMEDTNNEYSWAYYTDNFDATGERTSRFFEFDSGATSEIFF